MRQFKITRKITNRDNASLEKYLQEIGKNDLLSHEEEFELAKKIRNGDEGALEKLVKSNLKFVVSVAKNYQNQGLPLSDLINEGNIGLMEAAKRFDETKGFKFISYAIWWIRQSIMQALSQNSRIARLPLNRLTRINEIKKVQDRFQQTTGRDPTISELAEIFNTSEEEIEVTLKSISYHAHLDGPVSFEDDMTLVETLEDPNIKSPDFEIDYLNSLKTDLISCLNLLTERQRGILVLFFGINCERMDIEEISKIMNLSRERIRQIKESSLRRLKLKHRVFLKKHR